MKYNIILSSIFTVIFSLALTKIQSKQDRILETAITSLLKKNNAPNKPVSRREKINNRISKSKYMQTIPDTIPQSPERIVEDGKEYILFKPNDTLIKKIEVSHFNKLEIPDSSTLEFGNNYVQLVKIESLDNSIKNEISKYYNLDNSDHYKSSSYLMLNTVLRCKDSICIIINQLNLWTYHPYEFGEIAHSASKVYLLNSIGDIINAITFPNRYINSFDVSSNKKFLFFDSGTIYGEGGEYKIPSQQTLIDIHTKEIKLNTNFMNDIASIYEVNNLFYVREFGSKKGGEIINIIDPSNQILYRADLPPNKLYFKEFKPTGISLEDGSMLEFKKDFEIYTFQELNN